MILVFDVGGTKIASGLVCPLTRQVSHSTKVKAPNHHDMPSASRDEILSALLACLRAEYQRQITAADITDCVVAFPAAIDPAGLVHCAPTVWGDLPGGAIELTPLLQSLWPDAQTHILNDVTASGYAYVAQGHREFAIFTIGSGVGCKVFIDGHCITGQRGRGGEIGHLRVDESPDAAMCDCGERGHLGGIASGRGLLNNARTVVAEQGPQRVEGKLVNTGNLTNEHLAAAFHAGDAWAMEAVQRGARRIGQVLATLHLSVGLEDFVFIGGMAHALGEGFFRAIAVSAAQSCWDDGGDWSQWIKKMTVENSALVGGAHFARLAAGARTDGVGHERFPFQIRPGVVPT